jgi:Protein of unknown function (DUF4058)
MPIHDWKRVDAGIFHAFHHGWIEEVSRALNRGRLSKEYYALPEQLTGSYGPDVLTLQRPGGDKPLRKKGPRPVDRNGGVAVEMPLPKTRFHITDAPKWYAGKKKSVVVRHVTDHRVVAVLEIVSPGNKDSRTAIEAFVRKARDLLSAGVHLVLVDLFPPTTRDPEGIHPVVWGEDDGDTFRFNPRKPLTCASYIGGLGAQAFVEPVALGDVLPDMPIFLTPALYVDAPLEPTYEAAFEGMPEYWRDVLDGRQTE